MCFHYTLKPWGTGEWLLCLMGDGKTLHELYFKDEVVAQAVGEAWVNEEALGF